MKELWLENEHINLNLTKLAQKVIESDCKIFGASSNSQLTRSTLINRVLTDYEDDFELNEDLVKLKDYESYFKIRLSQSSLKKLDRLSLLSDFHFVQAYTAPQYIKCVMETYARLPFIEREKLLLKEAIIEPIKNAIARKQALNLVYKNEAIKVSPIYIQPAKEGSFQYLIGMYGKTIVSIRLSRIQSIKASGRADTITDDQEKSINENLAEFGATFIKEQPVQIKVRLTPKGIESYEYSVIHRPMHIAVEENNIFVFQCSETQALYFFFRFAGDAEILEPLSLRNKMRDLYQAGLNNYI